MNKYFKALLIYILILSLFACQNNTSNIKNNDKTQVASLLKSITIEALKAQEFEQAQRSISALIINNDKDSWKFIQSAIISLPKKLAYKTIDQALKSQAVTQSSEQMFGISKIYISYKKTELALKTINKSIALNKNNLKARYWRARLLTIMKDEENAEKDFKFIIKKDSKNEEYIGQYASFLQEIKRFDDAQKMLSTINPSPDSLFKRIVFALQNDNNDFARSLFLDLKKIQVQQDQQNHKSFLVAESAYWLKDKKQSEENYRKVSGGDHYLDARDMLSLILFESKKFDEAIEILHQLQNAEEKFAIKAYRLESQIYNNKGETEQAINVLTKSIELLPESTDLLYDRAMLYESVNQIEKLERDLLKIINKDPTNSTALNALGYSLADHGLKLDKAHEYIQKAIILEPENPAIIDSLGWVNYKLGNYQEAEENFNKAVELDINDPELYLHLYQTLLKLNKTQRANEILAKAKELFPDNQKIKDIN